TMASAMTTGSMRAAAYQRNNANYGGGINQLGAYFSTQSSILLNGRGGGGAGNAITVALSCGLIQNFNQPNVLDSRGLTIGYKRGSPDFGCYRNGTLVATMNAGASTPALPTIPLFIGCYNNNSTPTGFLNGTLGLAVVGAALPTDAMEA